MGAAIKPKFYISYIPQGKINIAPQIYASYIPDGKINIAPQIWASVVFVPHVEKATADTARNVSKVETFSADTIRKIGNAENTHADLKRNVKNLEKAVADTARKMGVVFATADTCRAVKNIDSATADSLRKVGVAETVQADSLRKVAASEKVSADTFLKITATEKAVADTCRRMLERASANACRKVTRAEKAVADTVIRYPHILNFIAQDSLINTFKDYDLSLFEVTLAERTLSDTFALETARQIDINDAVKGTFLDYPYSFLVEETTQQDLFTSVKGMYDVDKLLYSFIETDLRKEKSDDEGYYKASSYISRIADYLGFSPNIKIEDFTPYNIIGNTNITYSDLISSLFSWTSRLPQRQINVFIRGGTLHCIQRGLEDSVFDISDIPHSRPNVNKKLLRSMYNNPFGDNDWGEENYDEPFSGTVSCGDAFCNVALYYSDGLLTHETSYFDNGKLFEDIKRVSRRAVYNYIQHNEMYYLQHKYTLEKTQEDQSISITISDTVYHHEDLFKEDSLYLTSETEDTEKLEGEVWGTLETTEKTIRQTFHHPLGNGFYSNDVYENGEHIGSTISQGAPSNQVSLYTIQQIRRIFGTQSTDPEEIYEENRSRLAPIADISFPVRGLDLIQRLTDDLEWLNRKIQVTVTVELIDKIQNGVPTLKHVVDFTERVKLDGEEYFLISNTVSFTPRKLIQRLQLVRWE